MELLGGFEPPSSSLPSDKKLSNRWYIRLCGHFCHKKDEVENSLLHVSRPFVSPCGSRCGSSGNLCVKKNADRFRRHSLLCCFSLILKQKIEISVVTFYSNIAPLQTKNKTPGVSCHARGPGGTVLFCRLGIPFLAYASRSLRLRAMAHTSTPVSPVAGVLAPGVTVLPPVCTVTSLMS